MSTRGTICELKTADIQDSGSILVVILHDTKTKKKRVFTVTSECDGIKLYRKYSKLRPANVTNERFFLFYKNGKCSVQPVGIKQLCKDSEKNCGIFKTARC